MGRPSHGVTGGGLLGTWPELGAEDRTGSHLCHSHQQKRKEPQRLSSKHSHRQGMAAASDRQGNQTRLQGGARPGCKEAAEWREAGKRDRSHSATAAWAPDHRTAGSTEAWSSQREQAPGA